MHEAFNQTDPKGVADSEMIDAIIRSLILDNDRKFSEILSRLTLPQKELLYAIAKAGMAKQITSTAFVKTERHQETVGISLGFYLASYLLYRWSIDGVVAENVTDVRNLIFSKSFLKIVLFFIRKYNLCNW